MNTYDIGDRVVLIGTFENRTGTSSDPGTVALKVKSPNGTIATYVYLTDLGLVRASAGHYEFELDVTMAGVYYYYWYSTGTGKAAAENSFKVMQSNVV